MDAPPVTTATLVDFHPVSSDKRGALETSFLNDFGPAWTKIIKNYKLRLSFFNCDLPDVYLCMIIGPNDRVLMELAQKYQFPRGCPVLWRPDPLCNSGSIHTYGFFPKFDNDDHQEADDLSVLDKILEVSAFEKWSGFLGQLLTFSIVTSDGPKCYWTATSKNSADSSSPFVQDAKRLFAPHLTPQLIQELNDRTMHLCAEMISQRDQMHGAIVLKEAAIITAVGQGCRRTTPIPDASRLATFLNPRELVEFCHRHKLSCGSLVVVDNPPDAQKFLRGLSEARDWMTASRYEQLVQESGGRIYQGTVKHTDILGEILEGLVLRQSLATNEGQIVKKYKFPRYTVRTMFLRTYLAGDDRSAFSALNQIERFCDRWCVSAAGKDYWRNWAAQAVLLIMNGKIPKHPEVADHIITAELTDPIPEAFHILQNMSHTMNAESAGQVIIVVGPVGGGKSTVAQALSQVTDNAVHIDGDILDLARGTVLRLSTERNDYTIFQVIKAFMQGKIPVLSTGGGVLFESSYGRNKEPSLILDSRLHRTLGIRPKIIVFVPEGTSLEKIYGDRNRVHQVVLQRLKTGEWLLPEKYAAPEHFAKFIGGLSEANLKFAQKLMEEADEVHTYPLVTEQNHDQVAHMTFPALQLQPSGPRMARFNQVRYLVEISSVTSDMPVIMGHVTWQYDAAHAIEFNMAQLNALLGNPAIQGDVPGFIVTVPELRELNSGGKKKKEASGIQFAIPVQPVHEDGSTHITIDPGSHAPVCMKTAALALRMLHVPGSSHMLDLPIRNSNNVKTYDLRAAIMEKCTLHFLSVFGI